MNNINFGVSTLRENTRSILVATWIGIIVNVLLTILKAIGGILSGSRALLADALHSASDIVGSIVILFAVKVAVKPPDEEHPYGHGKAENVGSIIIALLLIVVGIEISISSVKILFGEVPTAPGLLALVIIAISIVIKEILFYYKLFLGKKYRSTALISEAWHHRSDSLSSLAALIGVGAALLGQKLGWPILIYGDALAGIVVSLIVIKVGYSLAQESFGVMMEKVLSQDESQIYRQTVLTVNGVERIDQMHARTHGSYVIIDIKISVNPKITVREGHSIAAEVKEILLDKHTDIEDVFVHVNPYETNAE